MFVARPGFHVELAAAEPLLQSPVAIDFDENGRIYVAQFPEYNQYASDKPHDTGCIRLLEDTDGDLVYDKSTLFAANVPTATAVVCWDGGIYVGSAPDLIYMKDTDGDGKADLRRVVFTGFGKDLAGEAIMNSFRWGLDNRFHISTNNAGGDVRKADQPTAKTVTVRGEGFLFDPRGETFELTGGGGQHGMSMDDWGRTYVCANSEPFSLVMYDTRHLARNPYLQAPPAATNVAPAGKFTRLVRTSPVEPWRALRTRLRTEGVVPGSDEGGSPSGFFTGATGVTVYRGDAFPAEYHGNLFVGDVANNIVHRAVPIPTGVLVTAQSAEVAREFLASSDNFFRPVQMANGPDGCLWLIDMYRELIEGAAFLPPVILKHMDVASGADRGRLWRIVPDGKRPRMPRLGNASTAELVALLEHPNGWHRDTASRLLYQRQDRSVIEPLKQLAAHSQSPIGRAHALYALSGLGALTAELALAALSDRDPHVREHAIRLSERFCKSDPRIEHQFALLARDPEPLVRYQLAFSLGSEARTTPTQTLRELAKSDGNDPWMRVAILSSITNCAGALFAELASDPSFCASPAGRAFLPELAAQVTAIHPQDTEVIKKALDGPFAGNPGLARAIVAGMMSTMTADSKARLIGGAGGQAGVILAELLSDARKNALDPSKPPKTRAAAVRLLRLSEFPDARSTLTEFLTSRYPADVQLAAVETLARFNDDQIPSVLLGAWPGMSPRLRATAGEALFARPKWLEAFLDAIENGTVGRADVDRARLELLKRYPDPTIRARSLKLFAGGLERRQDVVAAYQKALTIKGDRDRGRGVFQKNCTACHRLENTGQQIGADLSAVRDRGLDAVLLNILDPNREVMPQYQSYVLVTTGGRVITGMISAETANSLTIRKPDGGEESVLRLEIEELKSTGQSFMPEGLEKQIDIAAMADLLAYLNAIK
jgi:putative membrane-bound dehydrogenase-like protein